MLYGRGVPTLLSAGVVSDLLFAWAIQTTDSAPSSACGETTMTTVSTQFRFNLAGATMLACIRLLSSPSAGAQGLTSNGASRF